MIEFANYDQAIVHTLRKRAVQSAILIDDSFPTYEDCLAVGRKEGTIEAEYPDVDSARRLYRTLHEARIVCDVENRIDVIDADFIEKIRKSDLVVLDWNLKRGSEDSDDAERVLYGLAKSSHFNLVVVYTRTTDLTAVWTRAAVGLRGGWQNAEHFVGTIQLEGGLDFEDVIEKIDPDGRVEVVSDEMLRQYVTGGFRAVKDAKELREALVKAGVPKSSQSAFVEALVHRAAIKRHGVEAERPAFIVEGTANDETRHLVCGSVFIAFMSKAIDGKGGEEPSIFECLDQALVAWKPNLLQLLVSELQNELEQNSYAFNQVLVPSNELKAGWIYHMLNGYASEGEAGLRALVASLNERLVEALERAVWASMVDETSTLLTFGKQATKLALGELGEAGKGEEKLIAKAMEATSMNDNDSSRQNVMHALNEYLSSDLFRGGHVTTGTVFSSADRKEWFVCVSPACDMVPRPPKDKDSWSAKLKPLQPMHLLKLLGCKPSNALEDAELGVQLFISIEGERRYLKAVADDAPLPRPYTCLIENSSKPGDESWQKHGFVVHHIAFAEGAASLTQDTLFAVAQLRPAYGARLMHLAGSHQSRVGVDFVRYGKKKSLGDQAPSDSGKGHGH